VVSTVMLPVTPKLQYLTIECCGCRRRLPFCASSLPVAAEIRTTVQGSAEPPETPHQHPGFDSEELWNLGHVL
jgi:hypothetical protein